MTSGSYLYAAPATGIEDLKDMASFSIHTPSFGAFIRMKGVILKEIGEE
jgi:hypothetical protein